jgi:NAD(P)-dependent dehydrogenase (short-subunit alcohol dehydrogenase family)
MKVIITGSTRGIGQACKDYLGKVLNHQIVELNRPGYDLSANLDSFVSDDFDVYINNAYYAWAQVDLLYKLFAANQNRRCIIVNIGSVSADGNYDFVNPYAVHKAALDKACGQLQLISSQCKVVLLKLGRVDTNLVAHKSGPKMDPGWIAQQVSMLINYPHDVVPKCLVLDNLGSIR